MKKIIFASLLLFTHTYPIIKFTHRQDAYSTHQPILYEIATQTSGPIIEFGCGDGSTDLLHEVCKKTGRTLISIDDDLEWLSKFTKKYEGKGYNTDNSGWHKFYFVPGKKDNLDPSHWIIFLDSFTLLENVTFDVVFIDQSPWLARYETIKRLKDKARYIILHDCDFFPEHGIFGKVIKYINRKKRIPGLYDFSDEFRYFKVYFPPAPWAADTGPPTLVASNVISKFPEIQYNKY